MTRAEKHCAKRDYKRVAKRQLGSLRQRVAKFLFSTLSGLKSTCCPLYCQLRLSQEHQNVQSLSIL